MNEKEELFRDAPIPRAVGKMALPCVISSLVLIIYNMADTFFVGQTKDALQVAAVSLTNPVFVMFMAVANLLGIGGSAMISILMGKGEEKQAKAVSAFCCYASLGVGLVFAALIILFMEPLLHVLGSSQGTYTFARDYLFWIALGAPFILFANTFGHVVRGEGAAAASMIGGMIGTVVNIVLDPLFILTFGMGTGGAAIATVLGNVCGGIYYLWYFSRGKSVLSLNPGHLAGQRQLMVQTALLGVPSGMNSALMSIANVLQNNVLAVYGDDQLAAMGIVTKIYMLIAFIHMGIANGIQPLLGYSYGSRRRERFLGILKFSALLTVVCGTVLTVGCIIWRHPILQVFIDDASVVAYGEEMLVATSLAGPVLGILFLCINSMQALDDPLPSTILSVCRQGLLFIPLLYLLDALLGLTGVIYTQTAADYLSIVISLFLLRRSMKKLRG